LLKCLSEISVSLQSHWRRQVCGEQTQENYFNHLYQAQEGFQREVLLVVQNLSCRTTSHRRNVSVRGLAQAAAGLAAGRLPFQP